MLEATKEKLSSWYKSYISYLTVTPILVTFAIIIASVIAGAAAARNLETVQSQTVDKQMRENSLLIQNTFNSYEQIVWSEAGRVNSAPVDRTSWGLFVNTYQLAEKYPAVSRLALTRIVTPEEREGYLAQLSEQYGQPIQVINDTPGKNPDVLSYSSPERPTTVNNIGFNILSDKSRAQAAQRATDTNSVAMTSQIEVLINAQANETEKGSAFLMYAPYYRNDMPLGTVDERRAAVQGHVFASFKTARVFARIFESIDKQHVAIKVAAKDEKSDQVVFSTNPFKTNESRITRHQVIEVYGQTFAIDYVFDRSYLVSRTQLNTPLYTTIFGSLVGLLVGTVTFFFLRGRYHQVLLDKERDVARAKDELLSLASHQLRTPATGVKQYMGMVLQGFAGSISTVQEELLTKAYKSNERQLRVINDILHLAKLDLGRIVLAKTNFNLSELIHDVVEEQEQEIELAKLKLTTKIAKQAPVYADKHMLRMVVENLVSNAIKYTDPGGKLFIKLQSKGDGYYITIRDTGVGISPQDMQQLFKQFTRIQNSRSHLVTGTGVGLYLAKHLTQLHDGEIAVESKLGKGTSFVVFIPKED